MDRDNLLRRAHKIILQEHEKYSMSDRVQNRYHDEGICATCDLLREIDESLETPGSVCDCHPRGGTEGKHLLIDIV